MHELGSRPNVHDLFPELSQDMDRRILHAETRIKYWVVAGVLMNLLIFLSAGLPLVYYLGQIQTQARAALDTIKTTTQVVNDRNKAIQRQELWEQSIESWAESKGYKPPRSLSQYNGGN